MRETKARRFRKTGQTNILLAIDYLLDFYEHASTGIKPPNPIRERFPTDLMRNSEAADSKK